MIDELARSRYWKITPDELSGFSYDQDKLINWEIRCVKEPEEDARFIGIFLYRHGTPFDYESIKGIAYYHNNIAREELPPITKFLHDKYNGKNTEKGERVFLRDSKEIYAAKDLYELAVALESKFKVRATISLEFEDLNTEELKGAGLPEAKLLPIPGK